MDWKNININKNQIKLDIGKAILINCPGNSEYDGYSFWHPVKLVREGRHSASLSIGYNNEFKFTLKKYGKGKYNQNNVIDEKIISVEEFEAMFEVENENIKAPIFKDEYETHKPEFKKEVENNLINELIDEEE